MSNIFKANIIFMYLFGIFFCINLLGSENFCVKIQDESANGSFTNNSVAKSRESIKTSNKADGTQIFYNARGEIFFVGPRGSIRIFYPDGTSSDCNVRGVRKVELNKETTRKNQ